MKEYMRLSKEAAGLYYEFMADDETPHSVRERMLSDILEIAPYEMNEIDSETLLFIADVAWDEEVYQFFRGMEFTGAEFFHDFESETIH